MKFRAHYKEGSRVYQVVIDAETQAHARAKFTQAFPGSTLSRLEPIDPPTGAAAPAAPKAVSPRGAPRRMPWERPGELRTSDADAERLAVEARRLKSELRAMLAASNKSAA